MDLLPLIKHAIALSFLLVLLFSVTDFSVPAYFGVRTFTTEMFTQFAAFYNYDQAIGQSIILLLVCFTLILIEYSYVTKANVFAIGEKGNVAKAYSLNYKNRWIHIYVITFVVVSLVLPVFILLYQSFSGNKLYFVEAFNLLKNTIGKSLFLSFCGAVIISIIGMWSSYSEQRSGMKLPMIILLFLFITPSTVLGIAYIYFYNTSFTSLIYASPVVILFGYAGRFGFISHKIISNGLRQIPLSIEESAKMIGVRAFRRYLKIILPLTLPAIVTTLLLMFILCIGELGTTILVYPPGTELMPLKVYTISANAPLALTSAMTLINLSIISLLLFIFNYVNGAVKNKLWV